MQPRMLKVLLPRQHPAMKISILLLAVPVLAESAIRVPVQTDQTDHGCFRNSYSACKTAFACTSLHRELFHYSEGCEGWWRRGAFDEALDCCQCRSPGSPPSIATPSLQSAECCDIHFSGIARAAGPIALRPERRLPPGLCAFGALDGLAGLRLERTSELHLDRSHQCLKQLLDPRSARLVLQAGSSDMPNLRLCR